MSIKDFLPTIFFLLRFFGVYAILSVSYGFYIKSFDELEDSETDPITQSVVRQLSVVSEWFGYEVDIDEHSHRNYGSLAEEQTFDTVYFDKIQVIAVEEGCNGISVMILFVAFVLAFGGNWKSAVWFIPSGLLIIQIGNLMRLLLLAVLKAETDGNYFHFFHKYGFTAVIYLLVLILWHIWVRYFVSRKTKA